MTSTLGPTLVNVVVFGSSTAALNITYCISQSSFGTDYTATVNAMNVTSWMT
jgi:hypothetical protein